MTVFRLPLTDIREGMMRERELPVILEASTTTERKVLK